MHDSRSRVHHRARARAGVADASTGLALPRIAHPGRSTELRDTVGALRLPAAGVGFVNGFALEGASQLHDGAHRTVVLADVKMFMITEIGGSRDLDDPNPPVLIVRQ